MPTYTYRCENCNHTFEKFLSIARMDEPTEDDCPECSQKHIQRIISSETSIRFMDPVRAGFVKPSSDWTSWLNQLKKKNKGCPDFNTFR